MHACAPCACTMQMHSQHSRRYCCHPLHPPWRLLLCELLRCLCHRHIQLPSPMHLRTGCAASMNRLWVWPTAASVILHGALVSAAHAWRSRKSGEVRRDMSRSTPTPWSTQAETCANAGSHSRTLPVPSLVGQHAPLCMALDANSARNFCATPTVAQHLAQTRTRHASMAL